MTTFRKPVIYNSDASVVEELPSDEQLNVASFPISQNINNQVLTVADGLYVGADLGSYSTFAFYVSPSGTDVPASGAKAQPYKTIDYCIAQIMALPGNGNSEVLVANAIIALKCGGTFPMNSDVLSSGNLTFTYYGDTNYGDFGQYVGAVDGAVMTDLIRPVIAPALNTSTNGIAGIRLQPNPSGRKSTLTLKGVRVDLPLNPGQTNQYLDFVSATNDSDSKLVLFGAVVNLLFDATNSPTSKTGLFGIAARANLAQISEFASQFWINGAPVNGPTLNVVLLQRQNFIKFYPDYLGNNTTTGDLLSGSPGSSVLQLNWTFCDSLPVSGTPGSKTNLGSFPSVGGTGLGLSNYFTNLTRDQQQRPLNVICSTLI